MGSATSAEPFIGAAIEEAERAGIDMSLVEASLGYSYDKRAEQHQAALELALEQERIGRQLRGEAQPADWASLRRFAGF